MNFFTSRNLTIWALVQSGIVVVSVMGAGAVYRWYTELPNIIPVPWMCNF